jgi:hypothetical protein
VRTVVILGYCPSIKCRMPLQCSLLYHKLFVVLLWCADQHMHVHSFHLCPMQITVGLNNSTVCYCRMWQSGMNKIYGSDFGEGIYTKCLSFFLLLNLKYHQILNSVSFLGIYNLCSKFKFWNKRKNSYQENVFSILLAEHVACNYLSTWAYLCSICLSV